MTALVLFVSLLLVSGLPAFRNSRSRLLNLSTFCTLLVSIITSDTTVTGIFVKLVSFFHLGEFCWSILIHYDNYSFDSFLLNNSLAYTVCMLMSIIELSSPFRLPAYFQRVGLVVSITGLIVRNLALWTALQNFTHRLAENRSSRHVLVTGGIYSIMRHPGYAGWLLWVVGGQVLVGNPVCTTLFALISWNFFADRIRIEESSLKEFFGDGYDHYKNRTMSGIPGIL